MTTPASVIQDAQSLTALLSDPVKPAPFTFQDRQLQYVVPSSGVFTQSVNFDLNGAEKLWIDWSSAFLHLPLTITTTANMVPSPTFPPIAFKSSVLSAISRVVVKTASGQLIDEGSELLWANHLRLAMEADEDWLQAVGPELHYSRDRPEEGVAGLTSAAQIQYPNISRYTDTPVVGAAAQDGNFLNRAYNKGFHERQQHLMRATYTDVGAAAAAYNGTTLNFVARIPLRVLSDFFRQLGVSGPTFNIRFQLEFYLNNNRNGSQVSPITIGSVVGNGGGANTQSGGGAVDISITAGAEPRLYYHTVKLRPEHAALASAKLDAGLTKVVPFRRYFMSKDIASQKGLANGAVFTHRMNSQMIAAKRVWILCYPTGVVEGTGWPSVLATGPNGLTNLNVMINGVRYLNSPLMTVQEQYEALKDAAHMGADSDEPECVIPFGDFRLLSRVICIDISRYWQEAADPNGAIDLSITAQVASAGQIDIVYLVEQLEEVRFHYTDGQVRTSIGPVRNV